MSGLRVDQFVPTLVPRDAVGNHTLRTRSALASTGIGGDVWALAIGPDAAGCAGLYTDWTSVPNGGEVVLHYQVASVSRGMVEFLLDRAEPLTAYYHNLTPPDFYEPWDAVEADGLRLARTELARLAPRLRAAIANSEFSAGDLKVLGIEDVSVCPPFLGAAMDAKPDPELLAALRASAALKVLFVGRVAPNKGHRHLLRALEAIRAGVDPNARLYLAGPPGPRVYMHALAVEAEGVGDGAVRFTGPVPDAALAAYYEAADVFLCMSEHEGFGLPLVEAMRHDIPVIALDRGAVAETLGGAGVLLRNPDPLVAAEAVQRVIEDASLREALLRRQRERGGELAAAPRAELLASALRRAVEAGAG